MKKILFLLLTFIVQYNVQAQCPTDFHFPSRVFNCRTSGSSLVLSGSEVGVRYVITSTHGRYTATMYGTGSALDFGVLREDGYIVVATDTTSHCSRTMPDTGFVNKGYVATPTHHVDSACANSFLNMWDSTFAGTWISSDSSVAYVSNILAYDEGDCFFSVKTTNAGTATIIHTVPSTCPDNVDTFVIVVDSSRTPTITGPSTLCVGMSGVFTASGSGHSRWSSTNRYVGTIDTLGAITAVGIGTVSIVDSYSIGRCIIVLLSPVVVANSDSALVTGMGILPIGASSTYTTTLSSPVWSSTNPTVATISSTGVATGVSVGFLNICAQGSSSSCGSKFVITPPATAHTSDSFAVNVTNRCGYSLFTFYNSIPDTGLYLTSYFGDGASSRVRLSGTRAIGVDSTIHTYSAAGSYTVRQILSRGTVPLDSVLYTCDYLPCFSTRLQFFIDADSNCSRATTEADGWIGIRIAIDSAGVPLDTVSCLSGINILKYGSVGTIYHYRLLPNPYVRITCPSSGVISDTVNTIASVLQVALKPSAGVNFDFRLADRFRWYRNGMGAQIRVYNDFSLPRSGTVTLIHDTVFHSYYITPTPTSTTDTSVTWNFSSLSIDSGYFQFYFGGRVAGGVLPLGTVFHTRVIVTPTTGDYDSTNNIDDRYDTVRSSWDPNTCTVQPDGDIFDGTTLHYTIGFENTGNDTARNIHIMDTLSDFLDVSSLVVESASSTMNISYLRAGGHNIIKFDFPHINLPDTSHHGLADGFVIFHIKPNSSLSDRTEIYNRAGIYFDENDVVLTNYAHNRIINPSVTITRTIDTICHGGTNRFVAAPHTTGVQHYRWRVNSTFFAHDSAEFTHTGFSGGDTITCYMTTVLGDSSREVTSNSVYIIERALIAGSITGSSYACLGVSSSYTASVTGGTFTVTNTRASITSAGVLTANTVGADTIVYTVTNVCGSVSTTRPVTIYTAPDTNVITGVNHMCQGGSITLHDTGASGIWSVTNSRATNAGPVYTGVAPGLDTALYTVTNYCGTRVSRFVFTVDSLLASSVNITVTPNDTLCSGTSATFVATSVNGGASPAYYWFNYSTSVGTGPTYTYTPATSDEIRCMMLTSVACPSNDTAISDSIRMMVNITVTPIDTITSSASGDSITYLGQLVNFTSTATYCGSGTTYQWYVNGRPVAGATNYNYTSTFYSDSSIYCVVHCNAPCQSRPYDTSNVIIIHGEYLNHLSVTSVSNPNSNIALFPNPNTGEFMVSCITDVTDDMPYEVVDIAGRVVSRGALHPVNGVVRQQISGGGDHDLQPGQYVMRVVSPMGVNIMYFTVQR